MFMTEKPIVQNLNDGSKSWNHRFNLFTAKIYLPKSNLPSDIINFGFSAPYLLYFTDQLLSDSDAKAFAEILNNEIKLKKYLILLMQILQLFQGAIGVLKK